MVVSTSGGLTLSRRLARGAATDRQLEDAFRAGLPVEGKVERAVKGGFEVRIGRARAFCPDLADGHAARAVGAARRARLRFRIIEYKDEGATSSSRGARCIEERDKERAAEVRRSIVAGAVVTGRVASVRDFGVFVDLGGGVQGLLHVSEIGWSRVDDPSQMFTPGDEITVKVLNVDEQKQKISLGLKQLTDDPWVTAAERYAVGQVHQARVTRVAEFGAFVELEPGVEALAHASTFPPTGRSDAWTKQVPPGSTAAFEILSIDPVKKRIGVALVPKARRAPPARSARRPRSSRAHASAARVERHEKFGVFVFLGPGRTGLIPMSETGVAKDADVARALPVGADVDVIVLEVDPTGRRIRLSAKAVARREGSAEVREYSERADAAPAEGFGSLADKLRGALKALDPPSCQRQPPRHRQQIVQRVAIDVRQPHQNQRVFPIELGEVVGLGRVLEEPLALVGVRPDHERTGSADGCAARPAMKQPPTFSTGEPSYLVAASTPGSSSPIDRTRSKACDGSRPASRVMRRVCARGARLKPAATSSPASVRSPIAAGGSRRAAGTPAAPA
jgi:small subunit ribosomal protein S1